MAFVKQIIHLRLKKNVKKRFIFVRKTGSRHHFLYFLKRKIWCTS